MSIRRKTFYLVVSLIGFFSIITLVKGQGSCTNGDFQPCPKQLGACYGAQEICSSGVWPGCTAQTYLSQNFFYEHNFEFSANDGVDNDCDGLTDGSDTDCHCVGQSSVNCPLQNGVCSGARVSRNPDGTYPTCDTAFYTNYNPAYQYNQETACNDNLDNDCDGLADCQDSNCNTAPNCISEICNDNIDNDNDTYVDCQDYDCAGQPGPLGAICCWQAGGLNDNLCPPCQRCGLTGVKYCETQPNADEGNRCEGACTYCQGGSCLNRTAGSGLENECAQPCTACADNAGGSCVQAHGNQTDDIAPGLCPAPAPGAERRSRSWPRRARRGHAAGPAAPLRRAWPGPARRGR